MPSEPEKKVPERIWIREFLDGREPHLLMSDWRTPNTINTQPGDFVAVRPHQKIEYVRADLTRRGVEPNVLSQIVAKLKEIRACPGGMCGHCIEILCEELIPMATRAIPTEYVRSDESPILSFEQWELQWAAFIAAHPGQGPQSHVMDVSPERLRGEYARGVEDAANLIQTAAWLAEMPIKGDEQRLMNTLQKGADAIRSLIPVTLPKQDEDSGKDDNEV